MSIYKKLFGYFLILFSLSVIVMIGFPQFYSNNSAGRIDKEVPLNLDFLKNETAPIVLLYFGYVGCKTICTPSMSELSRIYDQIDKSKTKVYFGNLLDIYDKELPQLFAQHFHKDFRGVYLNKKEIQKIANQLRISFTTYVTDVGELDHSGYLYLLEKSKSDKNYRQKYIYTTRPFDEKTIVNDINKLTQKGFKNEKIISTHQ